MYIRVLTLEAKEPKPEKVVIGPSGTVTSAVDEVIEAYERAINSLKEVSVAHTRVYSMYMCTVLYCVYVYIVLCRILFGGYYLDRKYI